jgi:hypothetical protein
VAPPGGSIDLLAKHVEESLKNIGRFVASIWTALIESEYDFWERPKSSSTLDRSKMKAPLMPDSVAAFSAADSTLRKASAAGFRQRSDVHTHQQKVIVRKINQWHFTRYHALGAEFTTIVP